jgi:hypothetical protein
MRRYLFTLLLAAAFQSTPAADSAPDAAMQASVAELRNSVGRWDVTTEFLNEDGSIARSVAGTYEFAWVVPDRVLAGKSEIPALEQASGILFYINEAQRQVEMTSVGRDGRLWIMTGPLGGSERISQQFETASGGVARLRFTRLNAARDAFESRMEYTEDGGETWKPGNRQIFRRSAPSTR